MQEVLSFFGGKKTNLAADPVKRLDIEKTPKLERAPKSKQG